MKSALSVGDGASSCGRCHPARLAKEAIDLLPDYCEPVWRGTGRYSYNETMSSSHHSDSGDVKEQGQTSHALQIDATVFWSPTGDDDGNEDDISVDRRASGATTVTTRRVADALCGVGDNERLVPGGHSEAAEMKSSVGSAICRNGCGGAALSAQADASSRRIIATLRIGSFDYALNVNGKKTVTSCGKTDQETFSEDMEVPWSGTDNLIVEGSYDPEAMTFSGSDARTREGGADGSGSISEQWSVRLQADPRIKYLLHKK